MYLYQLLDDILFILFSFPLFAILGYLFIIYSNIKVKSLLVSFTFYDFNS